LMEQFVAAMKQLYQKIQLFAIGKDQSPYALVQRGLTLNQQQDVMLTALQSLAEMINARLKMPQSASLVIDNTLISSLVLSSCKQPSSGWRLWLVGKEQEMASKLVSVDLCAHYDFIAQAYYTCLHDYHKLFACADGATPEAAKKKLESLAQSFRKTLAHIAITTDSVENAEIKQVLDYITGHLEKILAELETCCSFAEQPMLVELFALHCAIVGSPGFMVVQHKESKLAESYARLAGIFFKKQPTNVLFIAELHTVMQRIKFLSNTKKPHEPVGLKDCIIKFIQALSALILGTSKEPMLDTLDQMLVVMHAATEWHGNERKQASTLMEWLLPASVRSHPAIKNVLLNNNIITHVAALGIVPAGYKLAEMFFGKREQPADQQIKELLQLAKDNPAAYADLLNQNPAIRERLAQHFVPVPAASIAH